MAKKQTNDLKSTAQKYLDIFDITSDLLILKDGSVSLILQVNALNFGLLSEPEQDAIIYAYAALINSLSFPIEIVVKSQPKDVTRYLEYVDEQLTHAPTELRRRQIAQYRQFVSNLITEQNVLDKTFYLVIPLTALELGLTDGLNPLNSLTGNEKTPEFDKYALVEKAKNILIPRRDHMMSQFGRIGLNARQLGTKEIIQIFYAAYNFEAAEGARMVDTREYTTAVIQTDAGPVPNFQSAPQPIPAENPQPSATPQEPATTGDNGFAGMEPVTQQYDSTSDSANMTLENLTAVPQEGFNNQQPR
jgi:hypothetical protein